jgi:hypothetical protein
MTRISSPTVRSESDYPVPTLTVAADAGRVFLTQLI